VFDPHSLVLYRSFTAMLVWGFFNFTKMFVCYYHYTIYMHISFIFHKVV